MGPSRDVTISSTGRLTLPAAIRKALRLGSRRKVRVAMTKQGLITVRPLPDVGSFYGSLAGRVAHHRGEKSKGRAAMGRQAAGKR